MILRCYVIPSAKFVEKGNWSFVGDLFHFEAAVEMINLRPEGKWLPLVEFMNTGYGDLICFPSTYPNI